MGPLPAIRQVNFWRVWKSRFINVSETTDTENVDLIFGAPVPKSETPPVLLKLQQAIQGLLDRMDKDPLAAAEKLSQTGLDSPEARAIIVELCQKRPYVVECGLMPLTLSGRYSHQKGI
jgi:hypothetical protein